MDDLNIVQLFWDKDQDAIMNLAEKYGEKLYSLAYGILHNHEDTEEAVNDTYLKVWNAIPPEKPIYLFAFIAKICRCTALDKYDWNHAKKRHIQLGDVVNELDNCVVADMQNRDNIKGYELGDALSSFLRQLPKQKRWIFIRRYWYFDSIADISFRYGISQSKVKTTLHRTRRQLKCFLESEGINI